MGEDELENVCDSNQETEHELEAVKARLAEHRFYKQKVEFLEKESEMQYKRLKDQEGMINLDQEIGSIDIDLSFLGDASPEVVRKFELMATAVKRKDAMLK